MGRDCGHDLFVPKTIIANNLRRLMEANPKLGTIKKIVEAGGGTNGTVGRMVKGSTSCGVDALAQVSAVFGMEAWQLLVPDLDPEHPPMLEMDSRRVDLLAAELDNIAERVKNRRR